MADIQIDAVLKSVEKYVADLNDIAAKTNYSDNKIEHHIFDAGDRLFKHCKLEIDSMRRHNSEGLKTDDEILKAKEFIICQQMYSASKIAHDPNKSIEEKRAAIKAYHDKCNEIQLGKEIGLYVAAFAIALTTAAFFSGLGAVIGTIATLWSGPGAAVGALAGGVAGAKFGWALGILIASIVLGAAVGGLSFWGFFRPSDKQKEVNKFEDSLTARVDQEEEVLRASPAPGN